MKRYIKSEELLRLNSILKPGDTPRKLPKDYHYEVEKWGNDGLIGIYGRLNYADTIATLRGFHYEELVPGDGMWINSKVNYAYSVEISAD